MAGDYLKLGSTGVEEASAVDESAGAGDAGKIVKLGEDGLLDDTMMPEGVGADVVVVPAGETIADNDLVNLYDDSGTVKARKANATDTTKPCHGYVKTGANQGSNVTVYMSGYNTGSGLTPGSSYYLGTTGGTKTTSIPSTAGNIMQKIGWAISATQIKFEVEEPIVRA